MTTIPRLRGLARGAVATFALLAGLTTGAASSRAAAATTGACLPEHVSAVASLSSRPGGTTAQVRFTSRESPSCLWAVPTGYQFLDASGATIGPVVYPVGHAPTRWVALRYGFQVAARVTTMSGVHCTTRSATHVRATVPGRVGPLDVALPRAVEVCVGGTTAWTTVTEARVGVPRCRTGQLALSIGPPNGAAGTSYYPLRVRNRTRTACVVAGVPVVRALRSVTDGPVGPAARRLALPDYGTPLALAPGRSASAALGVGNVANWPPSRCAPGGAHALSVTVGGVRLVTPVALSVCTLVASLSVRGWVPGTSGQA